MTILHAKNPAKSFGVFFEGVEYSHRLDAGESVLWSSDGHGADLIVGETKIEVKAARLGKDKRFQVLLQQRNRTTIWDKNVLVIYLVWNEGYFYRMVYQIPTNINPYRSLKVSGKHIVDISYQLEKRGFKRLG